MLSNVIIRSAAAFGGTPFRFNKCTALGSAGSGATAGAAAGTSPTVAISGNKYAGTITITTGTSATTGVLATIDLKVQDATSNTVILFPADLDAAGAAAKVFVGSTATGFTINVGTSALANSTAHIWNYVAFNK
jgi:hypothetical protein